MNNSIRGYLPRHDWNGTCLHIGLILISVTFAIISYRFCSLTLQWKEKGDFRLSNFMRIFHYGVSVAIVGIVLAFLSFDAIEGVRPPEIWEQRKINFFSIKETIPWYFKMVGYDVFADLSEKSVSERTFNYWEIKKEERLESVNGANLRNRNLKNASLNNAFMVKADLRDALLHGANLREAKLQKADLVRTNLSRAKLENAILKQADFLDANLEQADFSYADLTGVKNLTIEQLSKVKTLYQAKLDPDLMEQVKKCCPHLLEEPKEEIGKKVENEQIN